MLMHTFCQSLFQVAAAAEIIGEKLLNWANVFSRQLIKIVLWIFWLTHASKHCFSGLFLFFSVCLLLWVCCSWMLCVMTVVVLLVRVPFFLIKQNYGKYNWNRKMACFLLLLGIFGAELHASYIHRGMRPGLQCLCDQISFYTHSITFWVMQVFPPVLTGFKDKRVERVFYRN